MSTVPATAPISIFHASSPRSSNPRIRAADTIAHLPDSFRDDLDDIAPPPKPLIGSMPAPSFLNVEMPPLALPPSSWENASFLGSNEFGNHSEDFMRNDRSRASSVPHDNRHARQQHSIRYPLGHLDLPDVVPSLDPVSAGRQQPPPSSKLRSVPFPSHSGNPAEVSMMGKHSPRNVEATRGSTRSRASSLEQTLERVLSSSLLGYNEADVTTPKSDSNNQSFQTVSEIKAEPNPSTGPSKLSELMVEETAIQFPRLRPEGNNTDDFDFIDAVDDEEEDTTNIAEPSFNDSSEPNLPESKTKFGSGDFGMFVGFDTSPKKSPTNSSDVPAQINIPMGGGSVFRSRSSSSPISEGSRSGSLTGSVTALSILSSSRTSTSGSIFLESDSFTERMNTEAVVNPSPVPFPQALRQLSKEVETRAAARSFELNPPPAPNLQTTDSPSRMNTLPSMTSNSRTQQLAPGLSDSAEWDAVREQPMMEAPFDMEV